MRMPNVGQTLVFAAPIIFVLLWSTGYLSGRILRPYVDPLTFSAVRFGAASAILVLIAVVRGASFPKDLGTWLHLSICGVLIQGFFIAGMLIAVNDGLEMGTAALVGGMQPIMTALLAAVWLKERFSTVQQAGFLFGFLGLVLVLWQGLNLGDIPINALLIGVLAVAGITLGTLYQKRYVTSVDLLSGTAIQFAAAFVPVLVLAYFFENGRIDWNPTVIATAVWLVVVQSIGAVLILFSLIRKGAVSRVSSLFYLVPPICAIQGYYLFDERLSATQIVGILIVAVSVIVITRESGGRAH